MLSESLPHLIEANESGIFRIEATSQESAALSPLASRNP